MSTTTVWSNETNELDSLESDVEPFELRIASKSQAIKRTRSKYVLHGVQIKINDTTTIYADSEDTDQERQQQQPQRLFGGATIDTISISSVSSAGEDEDPNAAVAQRRKSKYLRLTKITVLFICWLAFTGMLLVEDVHSRLRPNYICVPPQGAEKAFDVAEDAAKTRFLIWVSGPFIMLSTKEIRELGDNKRYLNVTMKQSTRANNKWRDVSNPWTLYVMQKTDLESVELVQRQKRFELYGVQESESKKLRISFVTNLQKSLPLELSYEPKPVDVDIGVIIALLLVIGLYLLLMLDIVHRALAIIVFCTLAIGTLAMMDMRPSLRTIIDWINCEVLLLIFGFTLIIAILAETGLIDYMSVRIYEVSNGHIWPILNVICLINFIGSALYDNILLILLTAPITMRICEVMELNPVPLLTCLIVSSNIGGVLTPNGDTPYKFIVENEILGREGIDWLKFMVHCVPGTLIAAATAYIYLRLLYMNSNSMRFKDGAEIERLRRVIKVWSRTAKSISPYSRDEQDMRDTVMSKVKRLRKRLRRVGKMPTPASDFKDTLRNLRQQFQISDYPLLFKCCFVLIFVFIITTLHLFPNIHYLSTAWTALLSCIILLILADTDDFDGILGRIEWSSMLFIACVIVFSEAMTQLGIFDAIGNITRTVIMRTGAESRLCVAILVSLWFSAFCAAFLTDSKVSEMMLRSVIVAVEDMGEERIPMQPLVWAVVLGTGLGSIGTIIGACANVVCAGLAEKHGYNFPFLYYLKVGFPIMLTCVVSATIYLMIAHIVFKWH